MYGETSGEDIMGRRNGALIYKEYFNCYQMVRVVFYYEGC